MLNDSTILDIISSRSKIIYNVYSPYYDINILFLELFPYNSNKFAVLVESFYGIYIFNIIDTTNIYYHTEVGDMAKSVIKDLYYNNISNIIVNAINNYINKYGIIPVSDSTRVLNLTIFVPFEYFIDSSSVEIDKVFKRYHGGLFVSSDNRISDFILNGNKLSNRISNKIIDDNVEKIYGGIYNYNLSINNLLYYYESVVYKKVNDDRIWIYYRNLYNDIEIRKAVNIFTDTEYNSGKVFFSFLPTNIIIYKNRDYGGFVYYRLLDLSKNFISGYLKDKYGIDYFNISQSFYPSKESNTVGVYKLAGRNSEIIPTYIYTYKNYNFNICDKIFNLSYFDLTESSLRFSEVSEIFKIFLNDIASIYYQQINKDSYISKYDSIFNYYYLNSNINAISELKNLFILDKRLKNEIVFDITNNNSYNIDDYVLEFSIRIDELSGLVNNTFSNIIFIQNNDIVPYFDLIIGDRIYFLVYLKKLNIGINNIKLIFLDPTININFYTDFYNSLLNGNFIPYNNIDDTTFPNAETQLLNSTTNNAIRRLYIYLNRNFNYDFYPVLLEYISFPFNNISISSFKNTTFALSFKYTDLTAFQNNNNHFDLKTIALFKPINSYNLNNININLFNPIIIPRNLNIILGFDRIYTSSTSINEINMIRKNMNINNVMLYFSSITASTGTLSNIVPNLYITGKGYFIYQNIIVSHRWNRII